MSATGMEVTSRTTEAGKGHAVIGMAALPCGTVVAQLGMTMTISTISTIITTSIIASSWA